ncbi:MAG: nuclear transport factor 2 family protein [Actinobacteria bacterium]|uniref:Unannotated protein n=1 Tax=freshwater metagenome TaxID=449393 RepID=A0A6J7CLU2_9ZZZZ|nr:nuclear transport factor 2 family protein [Actinomycetota bacterium]
MRVDPQLLADREAIREAAFRYSRGVDRLDADLMKSAYWPEATDDHGRFVGSGWEFSDRVVGTHDRWSASMHCNVNHSIEFDDPAHARGEIYNITYLLPRDGGAWSVWLGRYLDRYECRDGEWRIIHRICVHEGTTTIEGAPMAGDMSNFRTGEADRPRGQTPLGT